MKKILFLLLLLLPSSDAHASVGFYSTTWKDGKAWLATPAGKPFLSMGVNAIGDQSYRAPNDLYYDPVKNQYGGDKPAWVKNVFSRLKKWNFNTVGCWSDEDLLGKKFPFTYMLYIARGNPWEKVLDSVFTEDFEATVRLNAQKAVKFKDDPDLIGYFLDNEMPWWGEYGWRADGQKTLLEKYALQGVESANKQALKKFFEERYEKDIDKFDRAWASNLSSFEAFLGPVTLSVKTRQQKAAANAWAGVVAERYFAVTTKALREADPNHMILGVRFAGENPWEVVEACGKYCDVVSVNVYAKSGSADPSLLDNFYAKAQKPILLTEYSYSAMENQSGDPNTKGADVTVPTQKDRVEHYGRFARQLLDLPYIVGLHWFEWSDESPKGRFDGEDQNYGLVDTKDREYKLLTQAHTQLNSLALSLHRKASKSLPKEFQQTAEASYRKAEPGLKLPPSRPYLRIDTSAHVDTWGDGANGGKMIANTTTGTLELQFESGTGWGCGASSFCNIEPLVAWGTADLRGYNAFEFKAFLPKGLSFYVHMSEAGTAAPGQASYEGVNGSDGESYTFPSFTGSGKWETYRVDLADLERRTVWGNQKGNQVFDLQVLHDVQFYVPGNQGSGKLLVKDLEFKAK